MNHSRVADGQWHSFGAARAGGTHGTRLMVALGLGLLWLGLELWIRLGLELGMVGARLGRLGPVLGMAILLLQSVVGRYMALRRCSADLVRPSSIPGVRRAEKGVPHFWPALPEVGIVDCLSENSSRRKKI
jgi:hypothetical protein